MSVPSTQEPQKIPASRVPHTPLAFTPMLWHPASPYLLSSRTLPFVQGKQAPSGRDEIVDGSLCARWRGTGPDVLNDLPAAVWLAFEDDDVAAFGGDFSSGGDGG
jgi:hypothetical protein